MVALAVDGIDLFKIAGRSISGWVPSLKTGTVVRQPFCSQLEERLLLWLEYHPLVKSYARGDIGPQFATTYRLPIPEHAPFAIGYTFENQPHHYLLVLHRDTLKLIDGAGPSTEVPQPPSTEQGNGSETEPETKPEQETVSANGQQNMTETVVTVGEQVQTVKTPKCTFPGKVSIELKRFQASSTQLVECPDCGRTRTLSSSKGVIKFPSHEKRKTTTPNTGKRWARGKGKQTGMWLARNDASFLIVAYAG